MSKAIVSATADLKAELAFKFSDNTYKLGVQSFRSGYRHDADKKLFVDALWSDGVRAANLAGDARHIGMIIGISNMALAAREWPCVLTIKPKRGKAKAETLDSLAAFQILDAMGTEGRKIFPSVSVNGLNMDAETAWRKLRDIGRNAVQSTRMVLQARQNGESEILTIPDNTGKSGKSGKGKSASSGKKARTTGVALVRKDLGVVETHLKAAKADIPNFADIQKALKALIAMLPQG